MSDNTVERLHSPFAYAVTRRTLLRGGLLGGAGLAAAALIGCGGDDDDEETPAAQATAAPASTQQAAASDDGEDEGGTETAATPAATIEAEDTVATITRAEGFTTEAGRFVPFQIPEPDKEPKFGGTMTQRFTFDPGPLDPAIAAAGGTMTAVNMMYNRVIGVYSGWD